MGRCAAKRLGIARTSTIWVSSPKPACWLPPLDFSVIALRHRHKRCWGEVRGMQPAGPLLAAA